MNDFTIVNLQDLTTATGLAENDFLAIGQGSNALTKATIQQVGALIGVSASVVLGDKDIEPTVPSFAFAESGVYSEWGNVEITGDLGILTFDGTNFSKTEINFIANGVVEEGNTQAVSGGEVFENIRFTGVANDTRAVIDFNGSDFSLSISGTFFVVHNNRVINATAPQTLTLSQNPSVLYIKEDGTIVTRETSLISGVPSDAVVFATYSRLSATEVLINGLSNYTVNTVAQGNRNYFIGNLVGFETGLNFDITNLKVIFSSTNIVTYSNKRIVVTPQSQELTLNTSGSHILYVTQDGIVGSVNDVSSTALPFGAVVIGVYRYIGGNTLLVNGVDNYSLNGIPQTHLKKAIGKLISNSNNINVVGQTLYINGPCLLAIGRNRYNVSTQSVSFPSSASLFYFVPSTGVVGSTPTSSISMPADAIIFGGYTGFVAGRRIELWGIDNYTINGLDAQSWNYKLVQKKYLTDFNPLNYYYDCNTTLSMTDTDPIPLIGSDPDLMNDKYDVFMADFPDNFTKEKIATIPTSIGDRDINVFTYTPPTVSTAPRPDSGVVVVEPPHIFINCSIHGNEKTASIACWQFMDDMLNKWQDNKVLEWFRFNVKLSIIPVANPAGWVNGTRTNANLVDLNRNFPYLYIPNQNAGTTQWSGLAALDQPESLAINTWMEANRSKLLLGIDFHNFFQEDGAVPQLNWTEGVSQFTCQLGRVAIQRVSRGMRDKSVFFPSDFNVMLGESSYVQNPRGRCGGQMNDILPYGLSFEVNQNFRYNPAFKPNDNDAIKFGAESFGNTLMQFIWHTMQDYNSKLVKYNEN